MSDGERDRAEADLRRARGVLARCLERVRAGDPFFTARSDRLRSLGAAVTPAAVAGLGTKRLRLHLRDVLAELDRMQVEFETERGGAARDLRQQADREAQKASTLAAYRRSMELQSKAGTEPAARTGDASTVSTEPAGRLPLPDLPGDMGPNTGEVRTVVERLGSLGVEGWRALASVSDDAVHEERLQEAIASAAAAAGPDLLRLVFSAADPLAESATRASQALRGEVGSIEVPISASGWTGELEGTRVEYLAPQDRFPFRRAARNVLGLVALRPYLALAEFDRLWLPFEAFVGRPESDTEQG